MHIWQLQEAKAQLSHVIRKALKSGPQSISLHGEETAVILSKKDYDQLTTPQHSFWSFMSRSPLKGHALDIRRKKDLPRDTDL